VNPERQGRRGFALVVALSLIALLVGLATAVTSLVKLDGTAAATAVHQAAARQNALLALDVAVAELQRFAGPDARLTATADFLGDVPNPHLTGVWGSEAGATPLTWLVSGNEGSNPLAVTPVATNASRVLLVGPGTVGAGNPNAEVLAPLVEIASDEIPSRVGGAPAGRYAWWVGDEGVKASVALPDRSRDLAYPPFDTPETLLTLRSQMSRAPTFFSTTVPDGFDPQAPENVPLLARLVAPAQIAQLAPVGAESLTDFPKANFHQFTSVHLGVLANTRTDAGRGLKRDLSLDPGQLGPAFAAYANFAAYLEPTAAGAGLIPPLTDDSSMRRRYRVQAPQASPDSFAVPLVFSVAPVLTECLLQFSIQRAGPVVQVKARMYAGLWNPYTSALVPETLRLEVAGLPTVAVADLAGGGSLSFDLQTIFGVSTGPPYRVNLPFTSNGTNDTLSWLPGRLYSWTTQTGAAPSADLHFYDKNISATGWLLTTSIPGTAHLGVNAGTPTWLTVRLTRADGTLLATYTSPELPAFAIPDAMAVTQGGWNFGFGFRLNQVSAHTTDRSWLVTPGTDPRAADFPAGGLGPFDPAKGLNPAQYFGTTATAAGLDHFLIFRSMGGSSNISVSANNDVPLFELPRAPIVNLAGCQHLQVAGARPFALGNSWAPVSADGVGANSVFERFFFSGLTATATHPDLSLGEPLPNFHLEPVETRLSPSAPLRLGDLQSAGGLSSRHLLMRGAFNVNSTSPTAWQAALSSLRFADTGWLRADIDNSAAPSPTLGTQVAAMPGTVTEYFPDSELGTAGFAVFRFPQSAQETFAAAPLANPHAPTRVPFRRGVRGGDGGGNSPGFPNAQIAALAEAVTTRIRQQLVSGGPFRTLEEFLVPAAAFGGRSLLEDSILAAGLNAENVQPGATVPAAGDTGLSSQTVTQADLLGILAPFLQTRSDTFVVRAYGESVNPATGATAARAWCEARVQRVPATIDPADDIAQPAGAFGRRFRIVSFRWLSATDV